MAVYKKIYPTYAKLIGDEDKKKKIFEAFSSLCTWEPHLHDDVESSFHHTAEERLKDLLYDARKAYEVKNTPKDPYRPGWIGREVWNQLLHYWENEPHFKNRSAANKYNRSKGGSLHTQGSASLFAHAQDMVQKNGGDIDIAKVHKETHLRKKAGGYVDLRSETTQATYDEKILEFLQEHSQYSCYDDIPLIIRRDIWMQVTGQGTKKNKYGFGKLAPNVTRENLLHVPTPEERCRPTTFPPEAQAEIQRLTQELHAHREELNRRAQQEQHMQDRLDRLDREAEERRAMMNEQFRRQMDEQRRQMDEQKRQMDEYFRQMVWSKNAPNDQTNSTDDEASNESDSEDADD
ncbi:uridine/cytidine kinase [Trifolium repens]|nr:uridine/cytidine kinase [Trifolium repens]